MGSWNKDSSIHSGRASKCTARDYDSVSCAVDADGDNSKCTRAKLCRCKEVEEATTEINEKKQYNSESIIMVTLYLREEKRYNWTLTVTDGGTREILLLSD